MEDKELKAWRKEKRRELLEARSTLDRETRRSYGEEIQRQLKSILGDVSGHCVGAYWPFRGEFNVHPLLEELQASGTSLALPVVVEKAAPLEFWSWQPGAALGRGVWDIPIPAERNPVTPDILLVPLVGHDDQGYRLGYGGGYYDRTLAQYKRKPLAIGIGYSLGRLDTIHPQDFDIPMSRIVTEISG
ncbi:MAG: 5-formyltetrahydrofolate cyclo-ligase [Pseudomonadota bacterium]